MTSIELTPPMTMGPATVESPGHENHEGARRWLNVAVATVALIITAPLMLVIAVLVRLTSPGPVLYHQARIGIDRRQRTRTGTDRRQYDCGGRPFQILKFRTMYVDGHDPSIARWATRHDPRITPVGRWLRRLRLDELPQLINVLRRDMNVVGPRPEQPKIFTELRGEIAQYPRRQAVRPGITGLAQINQNYDEGLDDVRNKVKWDLDYIARQSFGQDLSIMLRTFPVMLKRSGW